MKIREPAVSGTFYPGSPQKLKSLIAEFDRTERPKFDNSLTDINIIGGVVPHAGYIYSGYEAVHFFSRITDAPPFDTALILNPNHRGYGPPCATDIHDSWKSPLGNFNVDTEFASLMGIPEYELAHKYEHAAEVMLPFLNYYLPYDIKIVPVSVMKQTPDVARDLARSIHKAISATGRRILVIASSDFSHFVQPDAGYLLDSEVIESIKSLNIDHVYERIIEKNITVCGYGPIMTLMEYVNIAGKNVKVKVLARGNSAKSRSMNKVVDYVCLLFYTEK